MRVICTYNQEKPHFTRLCSCAFQRESRSVPSSPKHSSFKRFSSSNRETQRSISQRQYVDDSHHEPHRVQRQTVEDSHHAALRPQRQAVDDSHHESHRAQRRNDSHDSQRPQRQTAHDSHEPQRTQRQNAHDSPDSQRPQGQTAHDSHEPQRTQRQNMHDSYDSQRRPRINDNHESQGVRSLTVNDNHESQRHQIPRINDNHDSQRIQRPTLNDSHESQRSQRPRINDNHESQRIRRLTANSNSNKSHYRQSVNESSRMPVSNRVRVNSIHQGYNPRYQRQAFDNPGSDNNPHRQLRHIASDLLSDPRLYSVLATSTGQNCSQSYSRISAEHVRHPHHCSYEEPAADRSRSHNLRVMRQMKTDVNTGVYAEPFLKVNQSEKGIQANCQTAINIVQSFTSVVENEANKNVVENEANINVVKNEANTKAGETVVAKQVGQNLGEQTWVTPAVVAVGAGFPGFTHPPTWDYINFLSHIFTPTISHTSRNTDNQQTDRIWNQQSLTCEIKQEDGRLQPQRPYVYLDPRLKNQPTFVKDGCVINKTVSYPWFPTMEFLSKRKSFSK